MYEETVRERKKTLTGFLTAFMKNEQCQKTSKRFFSFRLQEPEGV
jgi:hypothetical protein